MTPQQVCQTATATVMNGLLFVPLGDAVSGEEERREAKERILPDPVEEARRQADHPPQADASLPGRQQGAEQEETPNR